MNARTSILIFWLSIGGLCSIFGQTYPPSRVPDRIILTWSDDPATTQSVTWRTDTTVPESWAEIAPAEAAPEFPNRSVRVRAETEEVVLREGLAFYHQVTFQSLDPHTLYAYRVGDGDGHWSEWQYFRTASRRPRPFSFLYFGDAQNEIKSHWSRCVRQAYTSLPEIDFMVHAGDLINSANLDVEWGEWFHAAGWILGAKPSLPTPGNHEYFRNAHGEWQLSRLWRPTFTLPDHGPPGLEETVYFIDYQGVRFISLNTQAMNNDTAAITLQCEWLEDVLQDNPYPWTIVLQHHPVYSTRYGRDNRKIREALQPLYERYGVDLVLQGHDHSYGRGHNLDIGRKRRNPGPVYVVSVSGPKMYELGFDDWLERVGSNIQLYQWIRVEGRQLHFEAYTATGELYDAFQLRKRRRGPNRFVDLAPRDVPEVINLPGQIGNQMSEREIEAYRRRFQEYMKRKDRQ